MAQQTALTAVALPGPVRSFTAKTAYVFNPAAERTYTVLPENRDYLIANEPRVYTVLIEDRTMEVE